MASKSKKRRRVLGASCILAALIIAGSSFAWFTSKDEVTNRLSANADYDVRIVESFAPTPQWLPGQTVNKDVYAVNTGTLGAYVKETLSSKVTITRENKVSAFDADCEKLTPAERYVMEAGSYLALKPAGDTTNELGSQIVSMTVTNPASLDGYTANETTNPVITDFKPAANGLYVFRRTIDVADDRSETFTYDGYYYENGEFYKVEVTNVTADKKADLAGDGKAWDGQITAADVVYFKEETEAQEPVLTYDSQNNRIIATIPGIRSTRTAEEWKTALDTAADAYDDALHAYEYALAKQTAAINENATASASMKQSLATLNAAKAAAALAKQEYDYEKANFDALSSSYDTENAKISALENSANTAKGKMYGPTSGTPNDKPTGIDESAPTQEQIDAMGDGSYKEYMQAVLDSNTEAVNDKTAFLDELKTYCKAATSANGLNMSSGDVDGKTLDELVEALSYNDLVGFKAWIDNHTSEELHDQYQKAAIALEKKKAYEADLKDYNDKAEALAAQQTKVANLLAAKNASQAALYGGTASSPVAKPSVSETSPTDTDISNMQNGLYKTWIEAVKAQNDAQAAYDAAAGDTSANAGDNNATGKAKQLENANAEVVSTKAALDKARVDYQNLVDEYNSLGDIEVYINLGEDTSNNPTVVQNGGTKDQWQLMPMEANATSAEFYYTGILLGGETSTPLIDSVTLSPNVKKEMYKSFDFDINVVLNSAQVTYDTDGLTLTKDAVNAEFSPAAVTISDPTSMETALTWAKP